MSELEPPNELSSPTQPSAFNLIWVDMTIANYRKGPLNKILEELDEFPFEERSRFLPLTMEDAAVLTMAEVEADPQNMRLHKILSEAGKMCVDDYEQSQASRTKIAVRANRLIGNTEY